MGKALILLLLSLQLSCAATWYAAATGSETNGTYAQPWSVLYSVTNTNPHLAPGDTVIFKTGGTYVCQESNEVWEAMRIIEFRKSGTAANKITYRPETLWGFSFDGGLMFTVASNLIIRDFRIFCSTSTNRLQTNSYTAPSGINCTTEGNEILHNLIENTGHPAIGSWKETRGKYIAGNIIRFTGYDDWINYAGANRGSGMYLQNATNSNEALIAGNISYFNYTTGMKAYGNTDIWGFTFRNNICAENAEAGIFYHQDNYGSTNTIIQTNFLWNQSPAVILGYPLGNGGHSNAIVVGNYGVSEGLTVASTPYHMVDGWRNATWTNNIGVNLSTRYSFFLEVLGETIGSIKSHHLDWNTYYSTNTGGVGAEPFFSNESGFSLVNWRTNVLGESNSTHSYTLPSATVAYVMRPSTDTNFVHVSVFNWPTNATASVDMSLYFPPNTRLTIYDAQNIPNAYTTVIYPGGSVSLDLTLTNRATMLGTFTQRTDTWQGFDPRFRAFVLFGQPFTTATLLQGKMVLNGKQTWQ